MACYPIREEALVQVCWGSGLNVFVAFPLAAGLLEWPEGPNMPLTPFVWLLVVINLSGNLPEVSWAFGLCLLTAKLLLDPSLSCKGEHTEHFNDFQVGKFIQFVGNSLFIHSVQNC